MKFTPRLPQENVNISKTPPLREFFVLSSGILGGILAIYLILGFALDIMVEEMPYKLDKVIGIFFNRAYYSEKPLSSADKSAQALLDELAQYMQIEHSLSFKVRIADNDDINAVALPGGYILVYSGLIREIESENELAMVLAHELGHFAHRDHLRGLGRGVVLVFLSSAFFGVDSSVTDIMQKMLLTADRKYSRRQEVKADNFALDLVYRKYGHAGGTTDFFDRMRGKDKLPQFFSFFSSHPHFIERTLLLEKEIDKKGYKIRDKLLLPDLYKDYKDKKD